jgi:pyridoxal phosphate enzyme (YggS family)
MASVDIAARLAGIRGRIDEACARAGRHPSEVTLVAVSKTHPAESIRAAYAAGQRDFGENYAQELAAKRAALSDLTDLRWHFIGALQSNKAKLVMPGCVLVHAVDRESVAEALSRRASAAGTTVDVLIEANVAGESTKAGVPLSEVEALIDRIAPRECLRVRGLMCIPPPGEPSVSRSYFARLRGLRDALREHRPSVELLSMGMTGDFESAVAEGATHVRVGTAIFGARD